VSSSIGGYEQKIFPETYEYILDNHGDLFSELDHEAELAAPFLVGIKLKKVLEDTALKLIGDILATEKKVARIVSELSHEGFLFNEDSNLEKKIRFWFKSIGHGLK
jgi:hypothetical protein